MSFQTETVNQLEIPGTTPEELNARLKRASKKERIQMGDRVWQRLQVSDFTPLNRDELANLFCFIGWIGTQVVSQIVKGKRKIVAFEKHASGTLLFDARQAYELVKTKVKKSQMQTKPTNQYTVGPLPKEVSEFYASIARNKNTTINVIFNKVLIQRAQDEKERIESQLHKEIEERRLKLLKEVSIEL